MDEDFSGSEKKYDIIRKIFAVIICPLVILSLVIIVIYGGGLTLFQYIKPKWLKLPKTK